jgi:prepilin-type N-terminal cleavage/methylation domain-containing protein
MTNPFDDPITDDGSLITDHGCASLPLHHSALVIGRSSGIIAFVFPHSLGFPVEKAVSASRTDSSGGEQRCRGYLNPIGRSLISDLRFLRRERASARGPAVASRRAVALREGWLREGGFTLIELLVVMGIIAILMVLIVPAFTTIKGGSDVTSAAYTIKGVLDSARTYAKANNTYTWVGFYEENVANPASPNSDTPAVGRLVMSIVGSKDGTNVYGSGTGNIDPTKLLQVGKLTKIDNVHMWTHTDTPSGTGATYDTRPNVASTSCIGNSSPSDSTTPFQYPVRDPAPTAQYTFRKVVQFSPGGEARINNNSNPAQTAVEIGLRGTHGTSVDMVSPNVVALQVGGLGAAVMIYRK